MEVVRNTEYKRRVRFNSLDIGDVYETHDGFICIKTAEGAGYGNCIICYDDPRGWQTSEEGTETFVYPVQATLTINEGEEDD